MNQAKRAMKEPFVGALSLRIIFVLILQLVMLAYLSG